MFCLGVGLKSGIGQRKAPGMDHMYWVMHALLSERIPLECCIVNFQKMILQNGNNSNKIYFKVNTFLLP